MARPSGRDEQRKRLTPVVASAFAELGYAGATTAALAGRCGVQENVLYRLWADKKAMFLAALDHLFEKRAASWRRVLRDARSGESPVELLIEHESRNVGRGGLYRIVFAGLHEARDPDVRKALRDLYRRYHRLIADELRKGSGRPEAEADDAAWALIGLVTVLNVQRELDLVPAAVRQRLFRRMAHLAVDGRGG